MGCPIICYLIGRAGTLYVDPFWGLAENLETGHAGNADGFREASQNVLGHCCVWSFARRERGIS
jgi:hypothetical protein